jgi:hypothetical protein
MANINNREGIPMAVALKIPVCNIISCENITQEESKLYICNPFTAAFGGFMKKFYTYMVIQGIPNGITKFKIQILNPDHILIKESEESVIYVEENVIRAKTKWQNINFAKKGEYTVAVLLKCNNEFDIIGSSGIFII